MAVKALYITDPAYSSSWASEPSVRRLMVEFGDSLSWTYVMGGLARDYTQDPKAYPWLLGHWLDVSAAARMPVDPRLWNEGPISSTYPSCMAVKVAAEQADDRGYAAVRALREGLMCFRRKLDTTEALVEEARRVRFDVERFRIDLGSLAIVEAVCELAEPRAAAELWRLASEWKARPVRVLTGHLWEPA